MTDRLGEVLFEMYHSGNSVRVTAIHPPTGLEAVIVGPSACSDFTLKANARRKLAVMVAARLRGGKDEKGGGPAPRKPGLYA